jgi:hypothetical protein
MQKSGKLYHKMQSKSIQCPADSDEEHLEQFKEHHESSARDDDDDEEAALPASAGPDQHDEGNQIEAPLLSCESDVADKGFWKNLKEAVHQFAEELMAPPTISAIIGFVVGLVPWLKSLLIGDGAPLRVIQDSLELMGYELYSLFPPVSIRLPANRNFLCFEF